MTNLKLRNSLATPKLVIKVIISLDLSQVVVLKKYKHETSHILAEHLNMCMKDSCFSDYWNPSSMVTVLTILSRGLWLKRTTLLVFFMYLAQSLKNL